MRRVNLIGRDDNQSDASSETQEDSLVLHLKGKQGHPPFVMKGTSRDQPKSAPYPRLKNSKKTSKCQVFSFTVLENRKFFENKWNEWRAGAG